MKQFLKYTLASLIGTLLSFLIIALILGGVVASVASFAEKKPVNVKEKSVLKLELDKPIPERTPQNPFSNFNLGDFGNMNVIGLNDIRETLNEAKTDERIKGVYLNLSIIPSRMATIESIRESLIDFKESGKFIVAYSDVFSQKAYYLSTVADKIYMNPGGMMDFRGMSMNVMFFKGLLDKLDVEMQIIRYGEYKSAVEPFMMKQMSEANKEQSLQYISGVWNHSLQGIKEERGVSIDKLNLIADSMLLRRPEDAVKFGLIDGLKYKDELYDEMKTQLEMEQDTNPNILPLAKYNQAAQHPKASIDPKSEIAVVYAIGEIQMGEGSDDVIGSERISKAVRKARKDTSVKAIVLRVNSPGGSGLASEIIWREVVLAKNEKPVIVSMGDLAASGGYYIAAPADKIYAQKNTLTGSIGVFGVLPNIKGLLNNKLGITVDGVKTNDHADFGYPYRPLSDFEREVLQQNVDTFYMDFVQKVANGRDMSTEEVKAVGSGRIWNGLDAKDKGLIDEFGGLDKAIAEAAGMAELEDYRVAELPKMKSPFEEFFGSFGSTMRTKILRKELGETYKYFDYLKEIGEMETIQARLPYKYEIH